MNLILLTQNETFIIGWVAKLLGMIMNAIFYVIDMIGIPNIGLAIIIFTIVVYLLMMPLTIKQQKFSKLNAKINPEIQAIQAKYKGRKDQESAMAQNQEIQAVYAKYGVSPSGSCVQLLIQMPILFALYRVIASMPAYVTKIGDTFRVLADKIIAVDNGAFLQNSGVDSISSAVSMYGKAMTDGNLSNGIIDVLNKLGSADMATVATHYGLYGSVFEGNLILSENGQRGLIDTYNYFLGLNMGDSPMAMLRAAMAVGAIGIIIGSLAIPVLAAVTQWINTKLMPQPESNSKNADDPAAAMVQSMKTMNIMMPIMSAVVCFSFPSGVGIYWIAGAVIRSIQQIVINKMIDKEDVEDIIKKNSDKAKEKAKKRAENAEKVAQYGAMSTKSGSLSQNANMSKKEKEEAYNKAMELRKNNIKPGSLASKANLVNDYNERNNKGEK